MHTRFWIKMTSPIVKQPDFIKAILARNIIKFVELELSSGRTSPYYIDCRAMLQYQDITEYVLAQFNKTIGLHEATCGAYNKIAGVAMAGIPWATLLANRLNMPVMFVRNAAKTHGSKSAIDGASLEFDDKIILIEDVLTTGSSVIEAIRKIHNRGATVDRVICILDREEGAQEHIKYYFPDVKVTALFTITQLISTYQNNNLINEYNAERVEFYREKGYTETVKLLTRLNEDAKEKPYMLDPVDWHNKYYSSVWNLDATRRPAEHNNLMLDISNLTDWKTIRYKLNELGHQVRNVVIDFETISDWNTEKQRELLTLRMTYGFNIIYKSILSMPGYNTDTIGIERNVTAKLLNTTQHQRYPNYLLVNGGIILNLYIMANSNPLDLVNILFDEIARLDINTGYHKINCRDIYINLVGPGLSTMMGNTEFWTEFRAKLLNIIDNTYIRVMGIIFPYHAGGSSDKMVSLPTKLKLGRLVPIILDIGTNNAFYLEKSMVTDKPEQDYVEIVNDLTKFYNINGITHLMVAGDVTEANIPIREKMALYLQFCRQLGTPKQFGLSDMIKGIKANTNSRSVDDIFKKYDANLQALETKRLAKLSQSTGTKQIEPSAGLKRLSTMDILAGICDALFSQVVWLRGFLKR